MKWIKIITTSILMSLVGPIIAQPKKAISMQWNIAAILPADSGQTLSTGFAGPITAIHNNIFFFGGGANFPEAMPWNGGNKKYYDKIYTYFIKQHKLVPLNKIFSLPSAIAYSACCDTPEGVLFAGGENENGLSNKVWLMQWDSASQNILFKKLPDLPIPTSNANITLVENTVYVAGGETSSSTLDQFIALDLNDILTGWKQLPKLPQPTSHAVLTATFFKNSDQIFLVGGRKKNRNGISELYATMYVYDIAANNWHTKASLPYPLCAGTGIASNFNNILMFGGDKGTVFHKVELLIAEINSEKEGIKKQALILQKNKIQSAHPGFSNEVLMYNFKTDLWKIIGNIPFDTPVTTTAVKWGDDVIIPSGEIRAGVRSPKILSVKIFEKLK